MGQLTGGPGWEFDPSETGQDYSVSPNPRLRKTRPNKDSSLRKSKDSSLRKSTKGGSGLKVERRAKATKLDAVKEVGGPKKPKGDIQEMTFKEFESTYHQFQTYLKVNFYWIFFQW